jgi:hypothetical protein
MKFLGSLREQWYCSGNSRFKGREDDQGVCGGTGARIPAYRYGYVAALAAGASA